MKKSRRNVRFPGLDPAVHPKTRWEMFDQDYINKLSDEEKEWLSNFNEEYVGGNFQHKGKILHKRKKQKLDCYSRNNARNRDIFALNRTRGWVGDVVGMKYEKPDCVDQEDVLIQLIEIKDKNQK